MKIVNTIGLVILALLGALLLLNVATGCDHWGDGKCISPTFIITGEE